MVFVNKSLEDMLAEISFVKWLDFHYLIPDEDEDLRLEENKGVWYLHIVTDCLFDLFGELGMLDTYFPGSGIVSSYALENAFTRGNKETYLPVSVKFFEGEKGKVVRIRDSGKGFDFRKKIEQMKKGEQYYLNQGHGMTAMNNTVQEVSYEGKGSIVNIMIKNSE